MSETSVDARTAAASGNPLFEPSPLFAQVPPFDRIRDEHFRPAFDRGMAEHMAEVRAIRDQEATPTFANTIEALERSGALLTRVAKVFFHLVGADTNPLLQQIQSEVAPLLARHHDSIHLDSRLFARVQAVFERCEQLDDDEARRLVERYHLEFVRSGAQLPAAEQQRLRVLNEEHAALEASFQKRLLADTNDSALLLDSAEELDGLDASAISAAAAAATAAGKPGRYLLSLQLPSSQGVLARLRRRDVRERVFAASLARCSRGNEHDTRELVRRLAAVRAERAALLGYPDHASWVLADQMAGDPAAVRELLQGVTATIVAKADAEAAELRERFARSEPGVPFCAWDWAHTAAQVRSERYALDADAVRPWFELERVLRDGLFGLAEQLYGIVMRERQDLPVYHPEVRVFDVLDRDGSTVGVFYFDLYTRPSKRGGAWMDSLVDQDGLRGTLPVVTNVLNLPRPVDGQPTLLSFDEVTTLFHEFGHAVHGLFSRVRYPLLSGTAVPRDFVEFPSQFHEDFAFEPAVLQRFARHHVTGEPLPDEWIERIRAGRKFGQGFASLEYLAAAWLDLAWHTLPPGAVVDDVAAFERDVLQRAGVAHDLVPPRYRSCYFSHIWAGGYGAGYYAYLWSEALAADAFATVLARGGINPDNGQRMRDAVLSRGFTVPPMRQFQDFVGRELDRTALLRRRGLV